MNRFEDNQMIPDMNEFLQDFLIMPPNDNNDTTNFDSTLYYSTLEKVEDENNSMMSLFL